MFLPFKKRSWIVLAGLFCFLSFVLIVGAHPTSACGKGGCSKACKAKSGGHACPSLLKASSEAGTEEQKSDGPQVLSLETFARVEQYTCPMHPEVRAKKSGKCPECGMKLVQQDFYEVYACARKECPHISAKAGKCCDKDLQKNLMSKEEYYDLAQLQDEYFCPMHSDVVLDRGGKCPKCGMNLEMRTVQKVEEEAPEMLSYVCPMHPDELSDKPGNCSKCGMKLKENKTTSEEKSSKI